MYWEENPKNPGTGRDAAGKRPRNTAQFLGNPAAGGSENPTGKGLDGINMDPMDTWGWEQNSISTSTDGSDTAAQRQRLPQIPGNFIGFLRVLVHANSPLYPKNPVPFRNSLLGLSNPRFPSKGGFLGNTLHSRLSPTGIPNRNQRILGKHCSAMECSPQSKPATFPEFSLSWEHQIPIP